MAADAGSRPPIPRAARDDLRRWDDEADFPAWLSEPPPDAADLQRMSTREQRRGWIWFVAIVGLGLVAIAAAIERPAVVSAPLDKLFGAGKGLAVQDASPTAIDTLVAADKPAPAPMITAVRDEARTKPSEQDLASARQKLLEDLPKLKPPVAEAPVATAAVEPQAAARPAEPPQPAPPRPAISTDEVRRMLGRAASLVQEGQIGSARALLELASRSHDPAVYLALADTYNPRMLAHWRAIGIAGDEGRAVALYKQAAEGGALDASARLRELGQ